MSASPVVLLVAIRAFVTSTGVFFVRKFFAGTAAIAEFLLVTGCTDTVPTTAAVISRSTGVGKSVLGFFFLHYFASQRPEAPHGSTSPLEVTGSPISWESTCPSKSFSSYGRSQTCGVGVDEEK